MGDCILQKVQFQVNLGLGIGGGSILEKLLGVLAVDVPASPDKTGENLALFRIKSVGKAIGVHGREPPFRIGQVQGAAPGSRKIPACMQASQSSS